MVATATAHKLLANVLIKHYDFDPDANTPVDVDWVDMRDFEVITASFFRTVGTDALDTFTFLGNPQSNGGGTDRIIKAHAVANEPNAVGDQIWLEITADDLAEVGAA